MKVTTKDLRFHVKGILEAISRGEIVAISYRGKPCAKLVPIDSSNNDGQEKHKLFGIWKNNKKVTDVNRFVRKLRKGRFDAD